MRGDSRSFNRFDAGSSWWPPSRYTLLAMLLALWFGLAGARLFQLQILRYKDFTVRAQRQQQRTIEVSPRRGVIYDRNLRELAMSTLVDSVFAAPAEIPQAQNTVELLARVLQLDPQELRVRFRNSRSFCWVKRKVDRVEAERVSALNLKGVYLQKESKRFYPKNELAAHILGYVGLDEDGLAGVEQQFDSRIRGRPGKLLIHADARHRWFGRQEKPPDPGENLVLTLDEKIQFIVEQELARAVGQTRPEAAAVIVMNPANGEILALANWPTFNPNDYQRSSQRARQNLAVSAAYEPGSTFKLITISGALEEKLTRPSEVVDCQMGAINVFGLRIRDHRPFGLLTVSDVMVHSSDVGAIKLGLRLGPERLYKYIRAFGLGSTTGIELPGEARGLTKPPERWSRVSIGAISFGQEVGATPLQMAAAMSALANGGQLYHPRLIRERFRLRPALLPGAPLEPDSGRRVVSAQTADMVRRMLEDVVQSGTGTDARLNGYSSAGKTGTAQKYDPELGTYSRSRYVASFIGYAPASRPAVIISVVLDSPVGLHQGGQVAAPVFRRMAEQILAYLGVPHDVAPLPPARFKRREAAQARDLADSDSADPAPVMKVTSTPATTSIMGATVTTASFNHADWDGPRAPEFLGKSLRLVAEEAMAQGLEVDLVGSGLAREQIPAPGAPLARGGRLVVRFSR